MCKSIRLYIDAEPLQNVKKSPKINDAEERRHRVNILVESHIKLIRIST